MKSIPVAGLLLPTLFVALPARAADYYVAPNGSDNNAGTLAAPFLTVERGQTAAAAGDTVYIRGGTYSFSGTTRTVGVTFSKSGQQGRLINYFAYAGEVPIFDLFNLTPPQRVTGLNVTGSWIHIRGLEVRGVQQQVTGDCWGVHVTGSNNIIENLNVHNNEAPGIFMSNSAANNLILNCDSHHNYDPLEGGGNGDGFGCHASGGGNVIRGCRGYSNSDDGFDFINAPGTCTVEQSWSFRNGYVPDTTTASGNGAGFKSGGFGSPPNIPASGVPRHVIRFNLAFSNRSQGFYANHHPGGLDFINNTSMGNGQNFNMLVEGGTSTHTLRNNVAMTPGGTITQFTGGTDEFNSWTPNLGVTVSAADFMSTMADEALQPRQADGSLPNIGFMHLVQGSDLIDKGRDVGFPFTGTAPDLGAFEFGAPVGTGGAGGMGGTAAGGMSGAAGTAMAGTSMGGAAGSGAGATAGGTAGAAGSAAGATTGGVAGAAGGATAGGTAGTTANGGSSGTITTAGTTGTVAGTGGSPATSGAGGSPATSGTGGSPATGGAGPVSGSGGMIPDDSPDAPGNLDSGCGCRVPSQSRGASGTLVALVALAALLRRRRRA